MKKTVFRGRAKMTTADKAKLLKKITEMGGCQKPAQLEALVELLAGPGRKK